MPKKIIRRRHRDPLEEAANVFADRVADAVDLVMDRVIGKMFPNPPPHTPPEPSRPHQDRPRASQRHPTGHTGPTFYDDLEVSPHASQETITAAWRSLSKRYHPDVNKSSSAAERIKRINSAYTILGNTEKRKLYDRNLRSMS